jgi:hypothetical protein
MSITSRMTRLLEGTGAVSSVSDKAVLMKMAKELVVALHDQLPVDHEDAEEEIAIMLKRMLNDRSVLRKALQQMNQPGPARMIGRKLARSVHKWQTSLH